MEPESKLLRLEKAGMEPEGKLLRLETEWQLLFSDRQRSSPPLRVLL